MLAESAGAVRTRKQSFVLSALYLDGPLSRRALSAATGISASSVSHLVAELVENGLLRQAGTVSSNGGRPRTLFEINPAFGLTVGIEITARKARIGLFDLSCRRFAVVERALPADLPDVDEVARELVSGIREVLNTAGVSQSALIGVGIGLPSAGDGTRALAWSSGKLERLLGLAVPVFIEREVNNRALAESRFGAARGVDRAIVVQIGLGAEAALVADGTTERIRGWGHLTIDFGGRRCRCGARGCIEAYIGASGVLDRYRESAGGELQPEGNDFERMRTLVGSASLGAGEESLLRETAGYVGVAVGNLISLFAPSRLIIAGWAGQLLGARFLPEIRDAALLHGGEHVLSPASVLLGRVRADAALTGAAVLPVLGLIKRGEILRGTTT
nr:ROK family transcriptional regulator [Amycolatopsis sp. WAC 04197]